MKTHRILILALALLALPAVASAATPAFHTPAAHSLDAFLASLSNPAATAVDKAAKACGSGFCTQAQRDACTQQCRNQHHSFFVGLECCSDTCTTLCICGSVPVNC
jgi:hypothetical protein